MIVPADDVAGKSPSASAETRGDAGPTPDVGASCAGGMGVQGSNAYNAQKDGGEEPGQEVGCRVILFVN